jgi:hypothetical protein
MKDRPMENRPMADAPAADPTEAMMATWADLERDAPALAAEGRRLLYARGDGEALLATVRGDEPPRYTSWRPALSGQGYDRTLPEPDHDRARRRRT